MKKRVLKISIILTMFFLLVCIVFFFLMKNTEKSNMNENPVNNTEDSLEYDVSQTVENIKFLKLNTYDELKKYADEYPIYIQTSDDKTLFAIGELYIEDAPVKVFYKLNDDGTLNRFDGVYSFDLSSKSVGNVNKFIGALNNVISELFEVDKFSHSVYDETGVPLQYFDDQIYTKIHEGTATYALSIIDKDSTYWCITAKTINKEQINLEFFRCFDLDVYNDDSPNIDLRSDNETGE